MTGQTIRLFIKALIIGVLVNIGIQYVSTPPLPNSDNTRLHQEAPNQTPLNAEFQTTSQVDK